MSELAMRCVVDGGELRRSGRYKFHSDFFKRRVYKDRSIYVCVECGLRQANVSAVAEEELTSYYEKIYRPVAGLGSTVREYYKQRGVALACLIDVPPRRVFELGAGHCENLLAVKEFFPGADLFSNDLDRGAANDSLLTAGALSDGNYDVVILSHVLEHFVDPLGLLRDVGAALSSDGVVIIEVPNDIEGIVPLNGPDEPHLTFFTLETLKPLLLKCGLRVDSVFAAGPSCRRLTWKARVKQCLRSAIGSIPGGDQLIRIWTDAKMREFAAREDLMAVTDDGIYLRAVLKRV